MRKFILGLAALTVAVPALPTAALAQHYDRGGYEQEYRGDYRDHRDYRGDHRGAYSRYYDNRGYYSGPSWRGNDGRYYCRRSDGTTGLIVGAAAGALIGRGVDTHGERATGTILGAVLGAVIGKSIDQGGRGGRYCR
ncbi:glycine zipper 2TM domain-containing protein [Sphingomonas sp.]|uniref:glycine zipper 2TM domain-containing protein n=1 Tax=Sphingomonas sp. TaxID=28214 RepID=UPI001B1BD040|nr:glycine zipper 2TM domain-containing protein [Sphingomonas sp.]MBO9715126.1 glycine zipper 2TM domain-containing protein [Sphingomonas sp.]